MASRLSSSLFGYICHQILFVCVVLGDANVSKDTAPSIPELYLYSDKKMKKRPRDEILLDPMMANEVIENMLQTVPRK